MTACPLTSNCVRGAVVPIPTLPKPSITIRVVRAFVVVPEVAEPEVWNWIEEVPDPVLVPEASKRSPPARLDPPVTAPPAFRVKVLPVVVPFSIEMVRAAVPPKRILPAEGVAVAMLKLEALVRLVPVQSAVPEAVMNCDARTVPFTSWS